MAKVGLFLSTRLAFLFLAVSIVRAGAEPSPRPGIPRPTNFPPSPSGIGPHPTQWYTSGMTVVGGSESTASNASGSVNYPQPRSSAATVVTIGPMGFAASPPESATVTVEMEIDGWKATEQWQLASNDGDGRPPFYSAPATSELPKRFATAEGPVKLLIRAEDGRTASMYFETGFSRGVQKQMEEFRVREAARREAKERADAKQEAAEMAAEAAITAAERTKRVGGMALTIGGIGMLSLYLVHLYRIRRNKNAA